MIQNCFKRTNQEDKGRYCVQLLNIEVDTFVAVFRDHVQAERREHIFVDAMLPTDALSNVLFSTGKDPNESWVSLLEKAFAKVLGRYQDMIQPPRAGMEGLQYDWTVGRVWEMCTGGVSEEVDRI